MPDIALIELLTEIVTYDGRLKAVCSCGHVGVIDVLAVLGKRRIAASEIKRIGMWTKCRRCGDRYPILRLTLPDGQMRDYYRAYGDPH